MNKEIFIDNEQLPEEDVKLFKQFSSKELTVNAQRFFKELQAKEEGEFAPSADLLLSERDNHDEIYIVRYYFNEYRIGRGKYGNRTRKNTYALSLDEALTSDMFTLLDRHITLLEWLIENDFIGINYNGNYALR